MTGGGHGDTLIVDRREHLVALPGGRVIKVGGQKSDLLALLVRHFGRTVPHERIERAVLGEFFFESADPRSHIAVVVCRLRRTLARTGLPYRISTVHTDGYRLERTDGPRRCPACGSVLAGEEVEA